MSNILKMIKNAQKPVILVGNGMRADIELFRQTLGSYGIPTLVTWRAADLFLDTEWSYCGRPGMVGQRGANFILQSCDLLICLGARLDMGQVAFNYENFAPNARKIIVDVDMAEFNKIRSIPYCVPCKEFLEMVGEEEKPSFLRSIHLKWGIHCKRLYDKYQNRLIDEAIAHKTPDTISLYEFFAELNPYLEYCNIALGSSGSIAEVFWQVTKMLPGMRVINTPGLGSMGFALPTAIGMHYATNGPIICIEGDGSLAMNLQELAIIGRKRLPITIYVASNGGYASIRNTQDNLCEGNHAGSDIDSGLYLPNLLEVARAFDISYRCITDINDKYGIGPNHRPEICEVLIDYNHTTVCRTKTRQMRDGTLQASGLEDLWPFLDDTEKKQAMEFTC